jgi:hypothetical protein
MLRNDKLLLFILALLFSCQNDKKTTSDIIKQYQTHSFDRYSHIYNLANDSLNKWINDSLAITGLEFNNSYMLDSAFCFNLDSTRLFAVILDRDSAYKNSNSDYVRDFGGAKINNKWYFFFLNVSEPVARDYWQDSVYAPLTFAELSFVAHERRFKGIINKDKDGRFHSNESFFNNTFYNVETCKGKKDIKKCCDSLVLHLTKEKYKYKLTPEEIVKIKKQMAESIRPSEPEYSWWDKLFKKSKKFN